MNQVKPSRTPFLTAHWRQLIMLNYAVDPAVLEPLVPKGTELDSFEGVTYVSMVGFLFENTQFVGRVPLGPIRTFEEINLRFYVKRELSGERRRAACFIKEIVPSKTIAWTARTFYNENYVAMPTDHHWEWVNADDKKLGGTFEYHWERGKHGTELLNAKTKGECKPLVQNSVEEFILEHYWGYSTQKDGGTKEYQVWHPSWQYWDVEQCEFKADVASLYGQQFSPFLQDKEPHSAFVAVGSEVAVYNGTRIH